MRFREHLRLHVELIACAASVKQVRIRDVIDVIESIPGHFPVLHRDPAVMEAVGFIKGAASALEKTPLEMLDIFGVETVLDGDGVLP